MPINVSELVFDRLRQHHEQQNRQQSSSSTTSAPAANQQRDVRPQSPVGRRPQTPPPLSAEPEEVQSILAPVEHEHRRQHDEFERRQASTERPTECAAAQTRLIRCYRRHVAQSLLCARVADEFAECVQRHSEREYRKRLHL